MPLTRITSDEIVDLTIREEDYANDSISLAKLKVDETGAGANWVLATDGAGNMELINPSNLGSTSLAGMSDVDMTTPPAIGQVLTFDGNFWVPANSSGGGGAAQLNDLLDVTVNAPGNTQVLKYNGVNFVNAQILYTDISGTPVIPTNTDFTFLGLSDTTPTATADNFLKWNSAGDTIEYTTLSAGDVSGLAQVATLGTLESLGNVFITNVQHGEVLKFDTGVSGGSWVNSPDNVGTGGGAGVLNDLGDVTLGGSTALAAGQVLVVGGDNVNWENKAFELNDLADAQIGVSPTSGNVLQYNGTFWGEAQLAYSDISGTPVLATVATSGDYNDLSNLPTVPGSLSDLSDADTTGAVNGSILRYNGAAWVVGVDTDTGATQLNELTDVTITSAATGEVLRYNGTNWVDAQLAYSDISGTPVLATVATSGDYNDLSNLPSLSTVATSGSYNDLSNLPSIPGSLSDLSDADTTGAVNGSVLKYNGSTWVVGVDTDTGATQLNELTDVTITSAATGEVLRFDGSQWVDTQLDYADLANTPVIPTVIDDLTNVDTSGGTTGDVLTFNGTGWVAGAPGAGGGSVSVLDDLLDVAITSATIGEVLRYNGTNWVDVQLDYTDLSGTPVLATVATSGDYNDLSNLPSIPANVNDLSDVTITAAATGDVLQWNGSAWVDSPLSYSDLSGAPSIPSALNDLTDVTITSAATGEVLRFDGSQWVDTQLAYSDLSGTPSLATVATSGDYNDLINQPTIPGNIEDLSNVNTTGAVNGSILEYNGSTWVVGTNVSGATSLTELTDVTITSAATGEVLRYNGSAWVDSQLSYSDLSGTPTLATVATSGDYNDLINQPTIPTSSSDLSDIDTTGAVNGSVLKYNGSTWVVGTDDTGSGGEVNTMSNLGAGEGVFALKSGVDFQLKSLVAGTNISLTSTGTEITIDATTSGGASALNDLTDVAITSAATGEVLRFNGSQWVDTQLDYADLSGTPSLATVATSGDYNDLINQPTIPSNIEDLSNVDTTGAVNGSVLKYNGSSWIIGTDDTAAGSGEANTASNLGAGNGVFASKVGLDLQFKSLVAGTGVTMSTDANTITINSTGGGASTLNDLGDVTLSTPATGEVLRYNGSQWVDTQLDYTDLSGTPTIPTSSSDLSDIDTTGAVNGSVLKYNGSTWVVGTDDTSGTNALSDLTDVTLTAPATGEVLRYNGTNWVDAQLDYSDLSGTPSLATVATSGDYNDLINQPTIPTSSSDLSDIDTTGAVNGSVLKYNGSTWVVGTDDTGSGGEANTASNLGAGNGVFAQKNGVDLEFKSLVAGTGVTMSTDANTITINSTGGGASTLNDLSDVDTATTAPTTNDVLTYDGAEWIPQAPSASGGANVERVKLNYATNGDLSSTSDLTSGVASATILSPTGGDVQFKFTGLSHPPSSIIIYGYAYAANEYLVQNSPFGTLNTATIQAGGSSGSPIAFGTFSDSSVSITLTMREADTGASRSFGTTTHAWIQFVF